jgi:MFS family permease
MTGFYLGLAGFIGIPASILGGKLADGFGRKRTILIFSGLSILLYVIAGNMQPSITLVYVMICARAAMTTTGPAQNSMIADLTTPENRNAAFSLSYMGWNLGFAIGPVMGGLLYHYNLSWVFLGDALSAFLALLLILFFVKESIHSTQDEFGTERAMERREQGSIIQILIKRPLLICFALIIFGYDFTYSQWSFMLPMQAMELFPGHGAQYYGLVAGFNGLVVILFTPVVTKLAEQLTHIRSAVIGGALYAVGFGMLGVLNSLPFIFLWAFTFTIGEIILAISINPFVANHTPASHRGRVNAVVSMITGLGATLGPLGMGQLLGYLSIDIGWILLGGLTLIFAALMAVLEHYERASATAYAGADLNSDVNVNEVAASAADAAVRLSAIKSE